MRSALALVTIAAAFAGAVLTAVAWYYTVLLRHSALRTNTGPDRRNLLITIVEEGVVGLRPIDEDDADLDSAATFGLEWADGRAEVGGSLGTRDGFVLRPFRGLHGELPRPGEMARLDPFVFGEDPLTAHSLDFEEVTVETPAGPAPAWYVRGESRTWAIAVHGKGAGRREVLRILPALAEAGLPVLVPTYRNDPELPAVPGQLHGYGQREWPDIEAAVAHAIAAGAERVVLVGFSMGAGIGLAFMQHSPLASRVAALVFDSPMLSLRGVVERRARGHGMPAPLVAYGRAVASWRFGVDWKATDYRTFACSLQLPILLFHGDVDATIAVHFSDELAAACPENVRYVRCPGARHVRSWNADPEGYHTAVVRFLRNLPPTS